MGRLSIIGVVCSGISLGCIIVSTAIPYWVQVIRNRDMTITTSSWRPADTYNERNTYIGLWTTCTKTDKTKVAAECGVQYSFEEYYMAVRAFVLLGLFLVAIAAILAISHLVSTKGNPHISIGAGVFAILAGICMLIGVIIWGIKSTESVDEEKKTTTDQLTVQYHAGLTLAVIAAVAALGAGIFFIAGRQNPILRSGDLVLAPTRK